MIAEQHRKLLEPFLQYTRGNQLRLEQARCKYHLRKYCFTNRTVNMWSSLPNHVVLAESTNSFEFRLKNKCQEIIYNFKSETTGTGRP